MGTTVLTVAGAGAGPEWLVLAMKGEITQGRKVIPVQYPNTYIDYSKLRIVGAPEAVQIGMNNFDAVLNTAVAQSSPTEQFIGYGVSMGTEVLQKWIREKSPTSDVGPDRLSFVFLGNPERKYGGWCTVPNSPLGAPPDMDGVGVPDDTPYTITDFVRQYDGVGDQPNVAVPNAASIKNIQAGLYIVHNDYFFESLTDENNVELQENNIKYVWSPTYPLPTLATVAWLKFWARYRDKTDRISVEASYDRPVTLPAPDYSVA